MIPNYYHGILQHAKKTLGSAQARLFPGAEGDSKIQDLKLEVAEQVTQDWFAQTTEHPKCDDFAQLIESKPDLLFDEPKDEYSSGEIGFDRNWHEDISERKSDRFPGIDVGSPAMHVLYNLFRALTEDLC
jgi:hypothetical protein